MDHHLKLTLGKTALLFLPWKTARSRSFALHGGQTQFCPLPEPSRTLGSPDNTFSGKSLQLSRTPQPGWGGQPGQGEHGTPRVCARQRAEGKRAAALAPESPRPAGRWVSARRVRPAWARPAGGAPAVAPLGAGRPRAPAVAPARGRGDAVADAARAAGGRRGPRSRVAPADGRDPPAGRAAPPGPDGGVRARAGRPAAASAAQTWVAAASAGRGDATGLGRARAPRYAARARGGRGVGRRRGPPAGRRGRPRLARTMGGTRRDRRARCGRRARAALSARPGAACGLRRPAAGGRVDRPAARRRGPRRAPPDRRRPARASDRRPSAGGPRRRGVGRAPGGSRTAAEMGTGPRRDAGCAPRGCRRPRLHPRPGRPAPRRPGRSVADPGDAIRSRPHACARPRRRRYDAPPSTGPLVPPDGAPAGRSGRGSPRPARGGPRRRARRPPAARREIRGGRALPARAPGAPGGAARVTDVAVDRTTRGGPRWPYRCPGPRAGRGAPPRRRDRTETARPRGARDDRARTGRRRTAGAPGSRPAARTYVAALRRAGRRPAAGARGPRVRSAARPGPVDDDTRPTRPAATQPGAAPTGARARLARGRAAARGAQARCARPRRPARGAAGASASGPRRRRRPRGTGRERGGGRGREGGGRRRRGPGRTARAPAARGRAGRAESDPVGRTRPAERDRPAERAAPRTPPAGGAPADRFRAPARAGSPPVARRTDPLARPGCDDDPAAPDGRRLRRDRPGTDVVPPSPDRPGGCPPSTWLCRCPGGPPPGSLPAGGAWGDPLRSGLRAPPGLTDPLCPAPDGRAGAVRRRGRARRGPPLDRRPQIPAGRRTTGRDARTLSRDDPEATSEPRPRGDRGPRGAALGVVVTRDPGRPYHPPEVTSAGTETPTPYGERRVRVAPPVTKPGYEGGGRSARRGSPPADQRPLLALPRRCVASGSYPPYPVSRPAPARGLLFLSPARPLAALS
nr:collagen alpha-1(II) chain-like [Oncorhynchus nerka]